MPARLLNYVLIVVLAFGAGVLAHKNCPVIQNFVGCASCCDCDCCDNDCCKDPCICGEKCGCCDGCCRGGECKCAKCDCCRHCRNKHKCCKPKDKKCCPVSKFGPEWSPFLEDFQKQVSQINGEYAYCYKPWLEAVLTEASKQGVRQ